MIRDGSPMARPRIKRPYVNLRVAASRAHGAERRKGPLEEIYQGCLVRFRPIMMTTMAALLDSLPIALGYGAGGKARQPLGRAVCGGLLFSQLVTLYLMPVVDTYMGALSQGGGNEKRKLEVVESPWSRPGESRFVPCGIRFSFPSAKQRAPLRVLKEVSR
jgi:AcrB/AcrD/AcrF family